MDAGPDPGGPAVVKASLTISLAQGLVPSLGGKVVVHMDMGVLGVGLSSPSVKVLLSEFPGGGSVGPENGPVNVGELWPFVVPSVWVEGVAVPSLAVVGDEGVEFLL